MTLKIGGSQSSANSLVSSAEKSVNEKLLSNSVAENEAAISYLANQNPARETDSSVSEVNEKKTVDVFLRDILRRQPIPNDKNLERDTKLLLELKKPVAQAAAADLEMANWRAIFKAAGYAGLSDENIMLAVSAMRQNGTVDPSPSNPGTLRKTDSAGNAIVKTDKLTIEYAKRAAQAALQYQNYKAAEAALSRGKAKTEVNNIAQDFGVGMPYETTRKLVDSAINLPQDSVNAVLSPPVGERTGSEPNFGRAKIGEMYDELASRPMAKGYTGQLPRINTEAIKYDFRSEMMRRDLEGKVEGDGIKRGDATTTATSILAPLVVGKLSIPNESPKTLKGLGAFPDFNLKPNKWN